MQSMEDYCVKTMLRHFVRLFVTSGRMHFATMSGWWNKYAEDLTLQLAEDLRGAGFTVLSGFGSYKGARESSLLILSPSANGDFTRSEVELLNSFAAQYHQESYLLYRGEEVGATFEYTPNGDSRVRRVYLPKVNGRNVVFLGDVALAEDFYSEFAGFPFSFVTELQ